MAILIDSIRGFKCPVLCLFTLKYLTCILIFVCCLVSLCNTCFDIFTHVKKLSLSRGSPLLICKLEPILHIDIYMTGKITCSGTVTVTVVTVRTSIPLRLRVDNICRC